MGTNATGTRPSNTLKSEFTLPNSSFGTTLDMIVRIEASGTAPKISTAGPMNNCHPATANAKTKQERKLVVVDIAPIKASLIFSNREKIPSAINKPNKSKSNVH